MSEHHDELDRLIRSGLADEVRSTRPVPQPPLTASGGHNRADASARDPRPWPQRRFALLGASLLVAASVATVAALALRDPRPDVIEVGDTVPPTTIELSPVPTNRAAPPPTNEALPIPTTTDVAVTTSESAPPAVAPPTSKPLRLPPGLTVAVAAEDGVHLLDDQGDRVLTGDRFTDLVADPETGALFGQLWVDEPLTDPNGSPPAGPIGRIGDDGSWQALIQPAPDSAGLRLHDVAVVDGRLTLFYEEIRQAVSIDDQTQNSLWAFDVDTAEHRKIADLGGWEEWTSRLRWSSALQRLTGERYSGPCWEQLSIALDGSEPEFGEYQACDDSAKPGLLTATDDGRWAWTFTESDPQSGIAMFTALELGTAPGEPGEATSWRYPTEGEWTPANGEIEAGSAFAVVNERRTGYEPDALPVRGSLIDLRTGGAVRIPVAGRATVVTQPVPTDPAVTAWVFPAGTTDATPWLGELGLDPATPDELADAIAAALLEPSRDCEGASAAVISASATEIDIEARTPCDDSIAGALYHVALVDQGTVSAVDWATVTSLCWRGVTTIGGEPPPVCL